MGFIIKLVSCLAIASVASALPTDRPRAYQTEEAQDSYQPQPYSEEASYEGFAIPTSLQLPKAQSAQVPFYVPELSTALKAPQYSPEPNYYQVPIPSQDLVAPGEKVWNPNNDPKFFYEVPASITHHNVPTSYYPKKYNKEVHTKSKPFSSKPKQEIVLRPIEEKEYISKQKTLSKVFDKLAKKENQKQIQSQQAVQI